MDIDPADPRLPSRPLIGLAILALPLIGVLLLLVGYGGVFWMGLRDTSPTGPELPLHFTGCPAARDVIAARLEDMGLAAQPLPDPSGEDADHFGFLVSMPSDPAVAASVPDTLVSPGIVRVLGGGDELANNSHIRDASVRMDLLMEPSLLIVLDDAAAERAVRHIRENPSGTLVLWVDGRVVAEQSNERSVPRGELEFSLLTAESAAKITDAPVLDAPLSDTRARWALLAAWSITVDHALPCPVRAEP